VFHSVLFSNPNFHLKVNDFKSSKKMETKGNQLIAPLKFCTLHQAIKTIILLVCFAFFIAQVHTFFELYLKNATVSGITYENTVSKAYPSISLCPEGLLKHPGFPLSQEEFDQHSFKLVICMYHYLKKKFFSLCLKTKSFACLNHEDWVQCQKCP